MALPRTLQQKITKLVDPPGKNRDVEEILLQVAQDPDCGAVVQQGLDLKTHGGMGKYRKRQHGVENVLCMMMRGQTDVVRKRQEKREGLMEGRGYHSQKTH